MMVELAARIAELGRQPYTAREFFIKYADRILFGTDGPRVHERILLHWRMLETRDEYFPYAENAFPPQGFWRIYGLDLPNDVLKKVYYENAARTIPGVREKLAPWLDEQAVEASISREGVDTHRHTVRRHVPYTELIVCSPAGLSEACVLH
jgi:hypothetical protein